MDLLTAARVVSAFAVVVGIVLGVVQLRQYNERKRRETMLELVHSFQSPALCTALDLLFRMPDGLSRREVEAFAGDDRTSILLLITTWESLGVLVHRAEIDLELIDDFFSGSIAVTWRKVGPYIEQVRREERRETFGEWCQWLAERMADREREEAPIPAYVEHREWEP